MKMISRAQFESLAAKMLAEMKAATDDAEAVFATHVDRLVASGDMDVDQAAECKRQYKMHLDRAIQNVATEFRESEEKLFAKDGKSR